MTGFSEQHDSFDAAVPGAPSRSSTAADSLPAGLKAICIIAVILGVSGMMLAVASGAGLLAGRQVPGAFNFERPELDPELEELGRIQQRMQAELNAILQEFALPNALAATGHLFTAMLLVIGSIMTLRRKSTGPSLLSFACAASILYLVGRVILSIWIQVKSMLVYERFASRFMAEIGERSGGEGAEAMAAMPKIFMIFLVIGLAVSAVIALAKITFYAIAFFYLRKPTVRAMFRAEGGFWERV